MQMYLRECKKLQVIPVGAYLRQPTQNALIIRHYNMGPNGARALAAPLLVHNTFSYFMYIYSAIGGAPVAQWVKRWPTDPADRDQSSL